MSRSNRIYLTLNYPAMTPGGKTLLTGIRGHDRVTYISGFYEPPEPNSIPISFIYKGNVRGQGTWNVLTYPSIIGRTVTGTFLYGPDIVNSEVNNQRSDICGSVCGGNSDEIKVVGNYTTAETGSFQLGALYQGSLNGLGRWTTLIPTLPGTVINTIAHSTMGNIVVGNYEVEASNAEGKLGKAFIYDIRTKAYYDIIKPGAKSITAYGVWHNGDNSYTICGGYSDLDPVSGIDTGYLVDWDNGTHTFSNWQSYSYNNDRERSIITHFDGISSDGCDGYNLTGDKVTVGDLTPSAFFAHVTRRSNGQFEPNAYWEPISFSSLANTSGNSVFKSIVIGVYTIPPDPTVNGYISIPA